MKRCNDSTSVAGLWLARLSVAVLVLAGGTARATIPEVCVANHADLASALLGADSAPVTIKIVRGTYDLNNTVLTSNSSGAGHFAAGTSLLGGYAPQCATRDIALGNTVFNNSNATFHPEVTLVGSLTIEGLTWHANPILNGAANALPSGTEILIRRSAFLDPHAGVQIRWFQSDDVGATVRIVDSIFSGITTPGYDLLTISNDVSDPGVMPAITMINNTVVGNANGFGVRIAGDDTRLYGYNNILYGNYDGFGINFPFDLISTSNQLVLVDNIIGGGNYLADQQIVAPVGTLSVDPQLGADYRPNESLPSPAINSGTAQVHGGLPSTDIDGRDREIGSAPDRGAYESNVNNSNVLRVTNANDSGANSLRAAIDQANTGGGFNIIEFAIGSTCGPHVITLNSPLPSITSSVRIDGYSQPGSIKNNLDLGNDATVCVILDGSAHSIGNGLLVDPNAAAGTFLNLDGLAFSGFVDAAVNLSGGSNHNVTGNHIGGSVGGVNLDPSGYGVYVGAGVANTTIGGDDPATRNIVGEALIDGIYIAGSIGGAHDNQIINNYVGVGWSTVNGNYVNRGNAVKGIHVLGANNEISGNLVGYNGNDGIDLDGSIAGGNTIENNAIGADADNVDLGNGSMGVRVENAGHDNIIRHNTIALNAGTGVRIVSGQGNSIRKNSIHENGSYGIDLAGGGVTPNDDDGDVQPVGYANRGQNFPDLALAIGSLHGGTVSGTLTTLPGDYTVDIYSSASCDDLGYGEGARWLNSSVVHVPSAQFGDQGTASFNLSFTLAPPNIVQGNAAITATATDAVGNTSEFSRCSTYVNDEIFANGFQ